VAAEPRPSSWNEMEVSLPAVGTAGDEDLAGSLVLPEPMPGLVLFAHGSGSSRYSRRNRWVAMQLQEAGFGTLLMDLLTGEEAERDAQTALLRFDIPLLIDRVLGVMDWLAQNEWTRDAPLGVFGASTGAAAALGAAASRPDITRAVVSRGGRPDLVSEQLDAVLAPTLLIVGARDPEVLALNRQAAAKLRVLHEVHIVPGATHLFEEPGALREVSIAAVDWFRLHLR
jgi:putative phosphoribosyl transferase